MPARTILLLILVNLLWALNVVVSKVAVDDLGMPPLFYAALRALLTLLVLFQLLRPLPRNWPLVAAVGLAIGGGSFALFAIGLSYADPSTAGIVSLSGAPMTVLLAIVLLGEDVGWRRGVGIALAIGGVVIAISSPSGLQSSAGLGWIGLSCLVWARFTSRRSTWGASRSRRGLRLHLSWCCCRSHSRPSAIWSRRSQRIRGRCSAA